MGRPLQHAIHLLQAIPGEPPGSMPLVAGNVRGAVGHSQALDEHNEVQSYQHPAENGHQMTGCFVRGGRKTVKQSI